MHLGQLPTMVEVLLEWLEVIYILGLSVKDLTYYLNHMAQGASCVPQGMHSSDQVTVRMVPISPLSLIQTLLVSFFLSTTNTWHIIEMR